MKNNTLEQTITKFPESRNEWQTRPTYNIDEVQDWFKRMIEDFPRVHNIGYGDGDGWESDYDTYDFDQIEEWKETWLSQFSDSSDGSKKT